MRTIKFRAWDTQEHKMLIPGDSRVMLTAKGETVFGDRMIIQQFTGLLDKNGKEIYEGDIIDRPNEHGAVHFIVEYSNEDACFQPRSIKTDWTPFIKYLHEDCEIIGNIYEHPELLLTNTEQR